MTDDRVFGEPDEADFADRPLPPRASRTPRLAILAAILAVIAMVAAGVVIGGGGGDRSGSDTLRDESSATIESTVTTSATPDTTVAQTLPPTTPASTTSAPATTLTTTVAAPSTSAPSTTQLVPSGPQLAIADDCLADVPVCTQLANTADGRIVAYSSAASTLTVLDSSGQTILETIATAGPVAGDRNWLVAVGPNDIAYLGVPGGDAQLDLYGVALTGPDQGSVTQVAEGLDGSGDTDLVPTLDGLAAVGCCGFDMVRPADDAPLVPWLDGARSEVTTFQITLGDGGNELVRNGPTRGVTSWTLPTAATSLRGMPRVVPTDDMGALMWVYFQPTGTSHLVRFTADWPEFGIDNTQVFHIGDGFAGADIRLLEPSGTVIVADDGALVRRTLDEVGDAGWPPEFDVDFEAEPWTVEAIGLNEFIAAEQPSWAVEPEGLAFQLAPEIGAAERFNAQFDPETSELTIEVSNFLDDSVFAARNVWPLTRGEDGLYRVGTATRSQQCQPGRGQQDFQPEPCI